MTEKENNSYIEECNYLVTSKFNENKTFHLEITIHKDINSAQIDELIAIVEKNIVNFKNG